MHFQRFYNAVEAGEFKLPKNAHNFPTDIVYYLGCADNAQTAGI